MLLGDDADCIVGQAELRPEMVLQVLGHLRCMVLAHAKHDGLPQRIACVEEIGEVRADQARPIRQGDLALELALAVVVARLGIRRHEHLGALLFGIGQRDALFIDVRLHPMHLVGGEETVADALCERVGVDRLSEVGVGVDVVVALGCGGHPQMHGPSEVLEDGAPRAEAGAVRLVDDDEVEEAGRVALVQAHSRRLPIITRTHRNPPQGTPA